MNQYAVNGFVAVVVAIITLAGNWLAQRTKNEPESEANFLHQQDKWQDRVLQDAMSLREEVQQLRDDAIVRFDQTLEVRRTLADALEREAECTAEVRRLRQQLAELEGYDQPDKGTPHGDGNTR